MVRVFGKLRDGFIICYLVSTERAQEVYIWLKAKTPCVEVWMEDVKW